MKILIINHGAFPYHGGNGCSVQLNSIITSFNKAGHQINLCCINNSFPIKNEQKCINNIRQKVEQLNILPESSNTKYLMPNSILDEIKFTINKPIQEFYNGYAYQQKISSIISEWKPNLIFAYTVNALTTYSYSQHKIPFVISSVDFDASMFQFKYQYRNDQGRKQQLKLFLKQFRAKKLDNILVDYCKNSLVCFEHAAHHQKYLESKGLTNTKYYPVNVLEPEELVELKPINYNSIKLGLLGNVTGIATLSGLVDFFKNYMPFLKQTKHNMQLHFNIIGGGQLNKFLSIEVPKYNNVSRIGFVDKLTDIYKMNDVIFVPTPIDLGFRTRIVEAFSYGALVITHQANADAMPEFIHKKNGLSYSNYQGFLDCINYLINNPEQVEVLRNNARQTFIHELKGELIGNKMLNDIMQALKNGE
jgi:glycosyltransferase involved in cell wall biosynthesis